jgi:arabinan endo-1,5-alpha-L-arabinosidase
MKRLLRYFVLLVVGFGLFSCNDDDPAQVLDPDDYNPGYSDDYSSISGIENSGLWGPYNLHDPSIIKFDDAFYIYSTDVMYGGTAQAGIMRRTSIDLVQWLYKGWVFDEIPEEAYNHIVNQGGTASTIWAPYALVVGNQIRLYYSVSVFGRSISAIGMATSDSPYGPWEDQGIVLSTTQSSSVNAIDPAVIVDAQSGQHWMSYGSYWSGIYIVELDPATGKRLAPNDLGKRIAARTAFGMAIEGGEILFNPELNEYFLFVSYDWLEDSYNVRVGRSNAPDGPFIDYFGNDMAGAQNNFPIITAQYKFDNHVGWQGFGHCGLMNDNGNYYYVSQARLASNIYLMDLHVRRILWTPDGWPIIAPERYVDIPQSDKSDDDIIGTWEYIYLENTETKNYSTQVDLREDGSIGGLDEATWEFGNDLLTLNILSDNMTIEARLSDEWDWENDTLTICFSGLSTKGRAAWGKKISP